MRREIKEMNKNTNAIKQRYRRAVKSAMRQLEKEKNIVFRSDGAIDLVAVDSLAHARLIKICLDCETIPKISKPHSIPLEIWVRKRGEKEFKRKKF